MVYDWSDAWLQQVAGWKAVKEGLALSRSGQVTSAGFHDDECMGVVGGTKPRKVKVRRSGPTHAETVCSCPENQRSGAMCEHAVAIVATAREQKSTPATPAAIPESISRTVQCTSAYRVDFFPKWRDEWKAGRLTVKISASARDVDEGDEILQRWLESVRVLDRPQPWMLSIDRQQVTKFIDALSAHSEVIQGNQTIAFADGLPQVPVLTRKSGTQVSLSLVGEPGVFFGRNNCSALLYLEQLFQSIDGKSQNFLFKLFTDKSLQITVDELLADEKLLDLFIPTTGDEWLSSRESRRLDATWEVRVDGGLQGLSLHCQASYQGADQAVVRSLHDTTTYLFEESNVCFYGEPSQYAVMRQTLAELGWRPSADPEIWIIEGESAILRFFAEGRGRIQACVSVYEESRALQNAIRTVVFIDAKLEVQETRGSKLSMELCFTSAQNKSFDPTKIRQWLNAGKHTIQTNDGKLLVLPKESWDVFLMTAQECHFAQEKGRFLAEKSQKVLIDYLRKYLDKTIKLSSLIECEFDEMPGHYPLLHGDLRNYQWQGVCWLQERMEEHGFALLADEMGLGKTIQTIALLTRFAHLGDPGLVVVPTSLLRNWELEIGRFAPSLKTLVIHGDNRDAAHQQVGNHHVIVTSYGILVNDRALFLKREYPLMILDEASMIRNPDTDVARSCFRISAKRKLALTGTPLENSVRDLWSIFQYLQPGYLGERARFAELHEKKSADSGVALESLKLRILPFVLRRTKEEVATDLPAKVEIDEWCDLSPQQQDLYRQVRDEGLARLDMLVRAKDPSVRMKVLTLLLRLRQICCDAALFSPDCLDQWSIEQRSAKLLKLMTLVEGSLESSRKMLVFSQFAKQLQLIQAELEERSIRSLRLDGATKDRQKLVDEFQSPAGPAVFLISLKAGGYGLNLTQASTVVHFDPWWNPAAERQASDRAHRIGQKNSVTIYKLLTRNTVEDRVRKMQQEKSQVADQLFGQGFAPGGHLLEQQDIRDILGL